MHLLCSVGVALLAATLVFGLWYPYPYRELSGGRELFLLVVGVDVVCGPLLTAVLFNPAKSRAELWRDLGMVVLIQVGALGYGLHTVWEARPLFLVLEVDRFKVEAAPDLDAVAVAALPSELQPRWYMAPMLVGIRDPKDPEERNKVLFESVEGGRDFGERAEFYLPYEGNTALNSLKQAKPLNVFLQKYPAQKKIALSIAKEKNSDIAQWFYLPVIARQDWIAILDNKGMIMGFLKGDGF